MAGVTGLGGVFLRVRDPGTLSAWYRDRLGVPVQEWHGARLDFAADRAPREHGYAVWALFPPQTTYFGSASQPCMVSFRVDDLEALLARLRAEGCNVEEQVHADEHGRFGWVTDPEGNRVELWEPPSA